MQNFEIVKKLGIIRDADERGWPIEVNLVSWHGRPATVDIRKWSPDHLTPGKGVSVNEEEAEMLMGDLEDYFKDK